MQRDVRDVDLGGDVLALAADGLAGAPFVEDVVGEVVLQAGAVLFGDGADEDAVAVEELQVDGEGVLVVGVVEEERVQSGSAGLVLLVGGGVDVVNWLSLAACSHLEAGGPLTELVSNGDALAGRLGDLRPAVELLRLVVDLVVVAEEGVEGSKTCPPVVTR